MSRRRAVAVGRAVAEPDGLARVERVTKALKRARVGRSARLEDVRILIAVGHRADGQVMSQFAERRVDVGSKDRVAELPGAGCAVGDGAELVGVEGEGFKRVISVFINF